MKRIKQINNLVIKFDSADGYSIWTPNGVCLEDRLTLEQAENYCRKTKDYRLGK